VKYKALVADDEYIIRQGISGLLGSYQDFEVVAQAEDGEIALEMAKNQKIDVYFVDITMPFLNGLQFIEELKKIQPLAIIVIITGYDKFEYAQEAIRLGTYEYLLKPVQEELFHDMIERLRTVLQKRNVEEHYLEWAEKKLVENRGSLILELLLRALEGHLAPEEIQQECDYLGLTIPVKFHILVIRLDYQKNSDIKQVWNDNLIFFAAQNVAKEIFEDLNCETSIRDNYGNLVLITQRADSKALEERTECYQNFIERNFPITCKVVHREDSGYEKLSEAYQAAAGQLEELNGISGVVQRITEIIEQNYGKEDFSLQDVAEEVNISVPYLSKLFRKEMGYTFVDYLTNLRIRKAIELLHDDQMKMYEIAERVGYATQHYFSNVFKRKIGISPIDYKKNIRIMQNHSPS
jgi:two-component system, response regulator YesN